MDTHSQTDAIELDPTPHASLHPTKDDHDYDPDSTISPSRMTRLNIFHNDLINYGYSPNCPKCNLYQAGQPERANSSHHSEECRRRIYMRLKQDDSPRLAAAEREGRAGTKLAPSPGTPASSPGAPASSPGPSAAASSSSSSSAPSSKDPKYEPKHSENDDDEHDIHGDDVNALLAAEDYINLFDVLQHLGVNAVQACNFVCSLKQRPPTTFMEWYGQGRIVEAAAHGKRRALNCKGLNALDLRTLKANGQPWDFTKKEDRDEAERLQDEQQPDFVIGSPPCTGYCLLNWNINFPKMDPKRVQEILNEARGHLHFMIRVYWKQILAGRHFLHEHPETARSWSDPKMVELMADPRVDSVTSHQCEYSLMTPDHLGRPTPAKKPTRWLSSSPRMLKRLSRRCQENHVHEHLLAGRPKDAALYPLPLIVEILRGMRDEADHRHHAYDHDEMALNMVSAIHSAMPTPPPTHKSTYAAETLHDQNKKKTSTAHYMDGSTKQIHFNNFKPAYKDEYTQETLDENLTHAAIIDEMQYVNDRVWKFMSLAEAKRDYPNGTFLGGRWITHNKGDSESPKIRCRYVATEVARENDLAFYASTPPT